MTSEHWPTNLPFREQSIKNPLTSTLPQDQKAELLCTMATQNKPIIDKFIKKIDEKYGTISTSNLKKKHRILAKANRPEIKREKPWFDVEHIRDSLRFRTALNNLEDLPKIISDLQAEGITIIKAESRKMLFPKAWGWRAAIYDLQLPNGQLVEYYLSPSEMIQAKDRIHHPLYELWRERDTTTLTEQSLLLYQQAIETSKAAFRAAWETYLKRTRQTNETVELILTATNKLTNP